MSGNGSLLRRGTMTPEMKTVLARVAEFTGPVGDPYVDMPIAQAREFEERLNKFLSPDLPEMDLVRPVELPAGLEPGSLQSRAVEFRPPRADSGLILFVHGGGWCSGSIRSHERFMRSLALAARTTVVGVEYRLAPEHPFPDGLNDVISAYRTVQSSRCALGLSDGPIILAGDSSGANLALCTMLHEVRQHRSAAAGALLFYGAYGLDHSGKSYELYGKGYGLSTRTVRCVWERYLAGHTSRTSSLAVPLAAPDEDLVKLPKLLLVAAELDPLLSDTLHLASRLSALGRSDQCHVELGVVHGFLQMTQCLAAARDVTKIAGDAARAFLDGA